MTTMFEVEVECRVCGEKCNRMSIGSTNSFGSPDLDTRPPEMQRSTIYQWIQRCPSCGYCSPDLSKCEANVAEIVATDEYQNIITNTQIPEMAASFLALSYVEQTQGQFSESSWRAIHAAWICDDEYDLEASISCREKAISLINQANSHSQNIAKQAGVSEVITIDLLRRAGKFQHALELIGKAKVSDIEEIILQVLEYQKSLIENSDTSVHTISEALGTT